MRARPLVAASFSCPYRVTLVRGLVGHFQQQRARTASWVINSGCAGRLRVMDADNLRDDAAYLSGSVELAFALATLGGEVPHQVFVGVTKDVVAIGAVLTEIERLVLKDRDEVGEPIDHLLAAAELSPDR